MLKEQLQAEMKAALKAGDRARLGTIRLVLAAIKQREVDERVEMDDAAVLAILDKMVKQRRDSITQYRDGGRDDLADKEEAEITVIQQFLPQPLSADELAALIDAAIAASGAAGMRDMGKVMGELRAKVQGRADMGAVSAAVKQRLNG